MTAIQSEADFIVLRGQECGDTLWASVAAAVLGGIVKPRAKSTKAAFIAALEALTDEASGEDELLFRWSAMRSIPQVNLSATERSEFARKFDDARADYIAAAKENEAADVADFRQREAVS